MNQTHFAQRTHTIIESPIGDLTLVATDGVLSGLYMAEHRHRPSHATFGELNRRPFDQVTEQLTEYFSGERTTFDLPIHQAGTEFQRTVWAALREIPYGTVVTYGQLAAKLGRPTASRAVGLANGKNPISIVVPCHRVVGSTGDLTGYAGGVARKRFLLDLENDKVSQGNRQPVQGD